MRTIERDLVDAAALLAELGLVHQGVTPSTVRWDGRSGQLWGLDTLAHAPAPYASPELREGTGPSDPRDTLWSTAQVMYRLVTGRADDPDREPADLADHRSLAHTTRPSFAARAVDRPTPAALLGLLSPDRGSATGRTVGGGLTPQRTAFDHTVSLKRAVGGPGADGTPPGYGAPGVPARPNGAPGGAGAANDPGGVLCPYRLE